MRDKFIEIAKTIYNMTSITTRVYRGNEKVAVFRSDPRLDERIDSFRPYISKLHEYHNPVGCITTANGFSFGFIKCQDYCLVIGPVKDTPTPDSVIESIAEFIDPTLVNKDFIIEFLRKCPKVSIYTMLPAITHAYRLMNFHDHTEKAPLHHGITAAITDIAFYNNFDEPYMIEEETTEKFFLRLIEEGRYEAVHDWFTASPFSLIDINVTPTRIRNIKDHFIIMSTLYGEAATRGGLDKLVVLTLQLEAIHTIEATSDEKVILNAQAALAYDYAKRVSLLKETPSNSKLIDSAMRYIQRNIYNQITTEDIANDLKISRGHLSKLFHSETGQTIHDYMLDLKIKEAKILLSNPKHSITSISELLGFSSQSYFTKVFKVSTGVTPRQYRQQSNN